jgi:hypothetical protein
MKYRFTTYNEMTPKERVCVYINNNRAIKKE